MLEKVLVYKMKPLMLGIKCTKARWRQLSLNMHWEKNERSIDLQMLPKLNLLCICFSGLFYLI